LGGWHHQERHLAPPPSFGLGTSLAQQHPTSALHIHRRTALSVSIILWLATIAGNVRLFVLRPASHSSALEILETLQVASLVLVALHPGRRQPEVRRRSPGDLHRCRRDGRGHRHRPRLRGGAVTYGQGLIGGAGFFAFEGVVLLWLLAANRIALRTRSVPRSVAILGIAAVLTGALLYPIWALRVARSLEPERWFRC
jgi:hypothetical protein